MKLPRKYISGLQDDSWLLLESRITVADIENVISAQKEASAVSC